jgi:glycerate dehydrogenase
MNIVELDGYAANPGDLSWEPLKAFGQLTVYPRTAPDEIVERAKDADAVLVNKVNMTDEIMAQLPRLKYIGVLATGYNVVDIDAAHRRGIVVTNIPAYSTDSVVQMTFAHILNITNHVAHYADENRQGRWSRNADFCYWDTPLPELSGKTMGIVGLGNIGMRVARLARDFGMDVFALTSKNASDLPEGIQKTTLEGVLAVSDILSLHCPLTQDTYHLIDAKRLKLMRPSAILINTGRGPLVDESAVAEALETEKLAAYGADVMVEEPPRADNPLFVQPHAYITPHIAWATKEARQRLMEICVENIKAFVEGRSLNHV